MTVIAITKEKQHLVGLRLDRGDRVLIDRDVAVREGITPGTVLTDGELKTLTEKSDFARAKERALWYLDRSDHSERALRDKLLRAGFTPEVCDGVLSYLREYRLVDDERYAAHLVERLREEHRSERDILQRMIAKGIPRDIARAALEENGTVDEAAQVSAMIEKKYRNKLGDPDAVRKVYAALIRRGFSYGTVRTVLRQYTSEMDEE